MAIELPESLTGEGVLLRPLRAGDAPAFAAAFRDDPDLGRLLGFEEDPDEAWVRRRVVAPPAAADVAELVIADPGSQDFRGLLLSHSRDRRHRHAEVGFWLVPSARGAGLGRAAVALFVGWMFQALDLLRVEMTTTPDNAATLALAARLGFTREGTMRARNIERGERVDVVMLAVLREEWPPA
jgi:RimJ/RimL family protein N-acetyltransferase